MTCSTISASVRSVRFHAVRLLRGAGAMLEERQAIDENEAILAIAGPRETMLLRHLLELMESADALEDEDLFAVVAVQEANAHWSNVPALAQSGGEKTSTKESNS